MSAGRRRDLRGRRRVGVQVPLGQPHRADVQRVRGGRGRPSPRISSVEPPPMSMTSTGAGGARAGCGSRRRRTAAASSSPETTSGSTPSRSRTPAAKTSALLASRAAEVAQKRTASTWCAAIDRGVLVDRGERAGPAPRRRAGRCGRRPGRAGPSASRGSSILVPVRVEVGDQQLDRVGAAVDGGDPGHAARSGSGGRRRGRTPRSRRAGRAPRRRAGSRRGPGRGTGRRARAGT